MEVQVIEKDGRKYLGGIPGQKLMENEQDALELIALCGENDTDRMMLYAENFPENFFDLKSGLAGMILQKFVNYRVTVAAVLSPDYVKGRFGEMALEANRGQQFRVFSDRNEAEAWLIGPLPAPGAPLPR